MASRKTSCSGTKLPDRSVSIRRRPGGWPRNILLRSTTELIRRAKLEISVRPTAALTDREAKSLFQFISRFRERGGAIFYISHRLDEILEYGDRISVLRDGAYITELDPRRTNKDEMVGHMAGRKFIKSNLRAGARQGNPSEIVLKVQDLARKREFDGVSFELRRGEILGVQLNTNMKVSGNVRLVLSRRVRWRTRIAENNETTITEQKPELNNTANVSHRNRFSLRSRWYTSR
jgi:ABC-type sugar transport system ATPase subunit